MVTLERFGLKAKKRRIKPLEDYDKDTKKKSTLSERGKKADITGDIIEKLVMEKLKLQRYKPSHSPDLAGYIDGKYSLVEVKHSSRRDLIIWLDQLERVHNLRNVKTIENENVRPYYGIVFSKPNKRTLYLVPTEKLVEIEKRINKTNWGLRTDKKGQIEKLEEKAKLKPIVSTKEDQVESIKEKEKEILERYRRTHFRITEAKIKEIAEKIVELE